MNNLIVGEIQYDTEYDGYYGFVNDRKWDVVRYVIDNLKTQRPDSKKGWAIIPLVDKKEAGRAQTAANNYARAVLKCNENGWILQTSVRESDSCVNLRIRKVWKK